MRAEVVDLAVSVAGEHSLDAALLCTVMQVESGGQPLYADGTPVILCESLHFYRRLPAEKRAAALKAGLATRTQPKGYVGQETPAKRVARLAAMVAIDETAAYEAVSMGLGQVMGWHAPDLGYGSAKEMYEAFRDPRAQVEGIYAVLVSMGAIAPLKVHDWRKVAALYNGACYARNRYDAKLAAAFAIWSTKFRSGQVAPPAPDSLGLGSKGAAVTAIQSKLSALGFPVRADGVYGPKLHAAVAAFQAAHGIPGTGVVDQATADAIMGEQTPMPQGAREVATATSLSPSTPGYGSRIVGCFQRIKRVHWTGAGANTGVAGIVDAHWQKVSDFQSKYETLHGWLGDGPQTTGLAWCATHPVVVAVGIGSIFIAYIASNVSDSGIEARVDDERKGATA